MIYDPNISAIGIDGGGTRCRFALVHAGKRVEAELGAANMTTDLKNALSVIDQGLEALAQAAQVPRDTLLGIPAHLGFAGVADPQRAKHIEEALPFYRCTLTDDRPTALRGALGDRDGHLAAVGTGSFFASQEQGHMRFIGGWGFVLGDEASGAWIGRAALRRVMLAHEQPDLRTALITDIEQHIGPSRSDVVHFAISQPPHAFATLAPLVADAADAGDDHAIDIMDAGAEHIRKGLVRCGWAATAPVVLTGGVSARYVRYLTHELQEALIDAQGTALDGAVILAQSAYKMDNVT